MSAPTFAVDKGIGVGVGSRGLASSYTRGLGQPNSVGLYSLNNTNGSRPGGHGIPQSVSAPNLNGSSNSGYNTGVVIKMTSGKGPTNGVGIFQKSPSSQMSRGIGITSTSVGGRDI
jgi:hypothetical protein